MTSPLILVVDDDEDIRETVAFVLGNAGMRTETAGNGFEALRRLEDDGRERPALLLVDLMMPILDGEGLLTAIRAGHLKKLPVVIMSGHHAARTVADALAANSCLTKPVDVDELIETVQRLAAPRESRVLDAVERPLDR